MNYVDIRHFLGPEYNFIKEYDSFTKLVDESRFISNPGGMDKVSGTWLYSILSKIRPENFVEVGVWRGFTSWIFDCINCYGARHFLFDPGFEGAGFVNELKHRVGLGKYFHNDFASTYFSNLPKGATYLFDDHQDCLERLLVSWARGARYIIFDDNYFYGAGGHNSFFDHAKRIHPNFFDLLVKNIYVVPPLFSRNKGLDPLVDTFAIPANHPVNQIADINYNWITLIELHINDSSTNSQGQICFD